jgi:2-dehydropantoate 2-reductase
LDVSIDRQRGAAEPLILPPNSFECVSSLDEAIEHGQFEVAIFAMKSFDTVAALDGIKPFTDKMPPILCLQNGVDNEPLIAAALGPDRVIAGTVTCSIARRAAGDIVLEKARGIGIAAGHTLSERLGTALNAASLNAHLYPRAADMKWSKLLANLPGTATSAIVDISPAVDLPKIPVRALALASHLPPFLARPMLVKAVGGGRGGKMPSFHIDLHAGRMKSEVGWQQGAVVRYGEKFGIPTPVNCLLTETLLAMVRGDIPIMEFSHQPEKLIGLFANGRNA